MLISGEHLLGTTLLGNSSHKLQVNVTFSGTVQVSAQRDNQKVQIKSQWSGGAGLQENEEGTSELKFLEDINNRSKIDYFRSKFSMLHFGLQSQKPKTTWTTTQLVCS